MDEEPVNVEERFGPGVIQVRWEMCGCAEQVAQWGGESHASLSIESRVVIQLMTHPPPQSQRPLTMSAASLILL